MIKPFCQSIDILKVASLSFTLFKRSFIYLWLSWVFVALHGLSLIVASGGYSWRSTQALHCSDISCCGAQARAHRLQQLWHMGLVVAARRLQSANSGCGTRVMCSAACAVFPDWGLNQCLLPWQVDSYPLNG